MGFCLYRMMRAPNNPKISCDMSLLLIKTYKDDFLWDSLITLLLQNNI